MITDNIYLDLSVSKIQNIRCSAGDSNSRLIKITLTNNGKLYNITSSEKIYLKAQRYNGTFVYITENDITLYRQSSNIICVKITDDLTAVSGICACELQFVNSTSNEVMSSCNFNLVVENSPILNSNIGSTNEFQAMNQILSYFGGLDEETGTLTIDFTGDINQSKQYMEQAKTYSESSKLYYEKTKAASESSGSGSGGSSSQTSNIIYSNTQPTNQSIDGIWKQPY